MKNGVVDNNNEACDIATMYDEQGDRQEYPAAKRASYLAAANWFELAAACSIGHGRSQRYYEAAERCKAKAEAIKIE